MARSLSKTGPAGAAFALGVLACAPAALANDARIEIMSDQLRAAPLAAASGLSDWDPDELPRISFARAADIAGAPIDYSRYRPRPKPGEEGKSSKAGSAAGYGGPFLWPSRLPLSSSALTGRFGARVHPILGTWRRHSGVDLAAPAGTPVAAPSPGLVVAAQWWGGYGLFVAVDHGKGVQTRYAHLSQLAVAAGQQVGAGQVLGYVGSTGLSTGPHLHYEMRLNGQPLDPLAATGKGK